MDGIKRTITPLWPAILWVFLLIYSALSYSASSEKLAQCKHYAHYLYSGARQHYLKMPRDLHWLTVEEMIVLRHGFPEYKDGDAWPLEYNIVRDDGETEAEKQDVIKFYQEGWDLAEAHPGIAPDESLKDRALDRCMNGEGT